MKNTFINKVRILLIGVLILTIALLAYNAWGMPGKPLPKNLNLKTIQQHRVNGVVTDTKGVPIPGVHVLIKGSRSGTFTNNDGTYFIDAHPTDVLMFSYIGFDPVEEPVGGRTEINITLKTSITDLGAVTVNAGYYTVKEKERTGSISKVSSKAIENQPVTNPLQSLQGRMAGVVIAQTTNTAGAASTIQIRGQNSLRSNGNRPLYVIDGVPVDSSPISSSGLLAVGLDPLNTLTLSNIESMEILKDADATAIYGSRGANGVVLITTKKGDAGKTTFNINLYSGTGKVINTMDMLNTGQYLKMRREAFANDGAVPTEFNAPDLEVWDQQKHTDWQKVLFGNTSFITNLQASLSGGTAATSFRAGGSYYDQGTVFPGDFGYKKTTGFLNLNHKSENNRFSLNLSANYGVDKSHLFYDPGMVRIAIMLAPNAPELYDGHGELNWENSTWTNPLAALRQPQDVRTESLVVNTSLQYELIKNLNIKAAFGYSNLNNKEMIKFPVSSYDPAIQQYLMHASLHQGTGRESIIVEPQVNYSLALGKGKLQALAGTTFQRATSHTISSSGLGYADESLIGNLAAADNVYVSREDNSEYKYNAIFGRLAYNLDSKYYLNLTGRRDGSSRFAPGNRFANFGAVGASWIFSEETFVQNSMPFLSFGKLRASYGTTGNDQIGDYGYFDTYQPTNGPGGLYPTQITNPHYSWEVNKKLETAIDLGFVNDRIRFSASYYSNRSSNQLVGYFLPSITGFTSIQANLPATVSNKGLELELSTRNIDADNFQWFTSFNITFPKNKLVSFPDLNQSSYANTYRVGEPLSSSLLYHFTGVNPDTGLYEFEDINGDDRYDLSDRSIARDFGREYYGGLNNSLQIGDFQLDFLFEFVKQLGRNHLSMFQVPPGRLFSTGSNQPIAVTNRWQQPGDVTSTQKFSQSLGATEYARAGSSDLSVTDASFIRLRTLSASYKLPSMVNEKIGLVGCKVYIHAQNLFTITGYKGLDPESNRGGLGALPPLRMLTTGVQLTF